MQTQALAALLSRSASVSVPHYSNSPLKYNRSLESPARPPTDVAHWGELEIAMAAADRHLLFGLIALQVGLIDQARLVAAFQAWARNRARPLADHLVDQGGLDSDGRAAIEAMVALHLKKHDGDTEKSLAAIPSGRSACERIAALGDPEVNATIVHLASGTPEHDAEATATYSVGTATEGGQRFRILRPHAQGGLGAVFVALDGELNREVALKQILERHADDWSSRQRFIAEAHITGGLEHPGVVPVYGLGTDDAGHPYYAMRFIKGDSLKEAIRAFHHQGNIQAAIQPGREGQDGEAPGSRDLGLRKLLRRFIDVCNAVDYAHSRGVIHRDLKPANIIMGKHGETLVVDWGLAKAVGRADPSIGERTVAPGSSGTEETLPGCTLGTPAYMSPEQARGELSKLGARSDVYSLGATLYCVLTGKPPFEAEDLGAVLRAAEKGRFRPPTQLEPSIERALEAICLKAMATRPEERYATARAVADDLERWMADEPVSAWREPFSRRARRWARRNRAAVSSLAAAVLVALAGTAAVLVVQTRANTDLSNANLELLVANDRVTKANALLQAANLREKQRFNLAMEAIKLFHGEVGDDLVLKADQFKTLRDRLLKSAADFYGKLEILLKDQPDPASRAAMGDAYSELGELTQKIGDRTAALLIHEKGLEVRRALAAYPDAAAAAKDDVARSLHATAVLLDETGNKTDALARLEESRSLLLGLPFSGQGSESRRALLGAVHLRIGWLHANTGKTEEAMRAYQRSAETLSRLVDQNPTLTEFRSRLAMTHNFIGLLQSQTARPDEALASYRLALSIEQKLADSNPAVAEFRIRMASTENNIGRLLARTGEAAAAMESYRRALSIEQKLAELNPAVIEFRNYLVSTHNSIGLLQSRTGKPTEALESHRRALFIGQHLADDNPAVTSFQSQLAMTHNDIGALLAQAGNHAEAMESYRRARSIEQKLSDLNPTVTSFRRALAMTHNRIGMLQARTRKPALAMESNRRALAIEQELADSNPTVTEFRSALALSHHHIGNLESRMGKLSDAMVSYRQALAIEQKLADLNPSVAEYQSRIAGTYHDISQLQLKTGKPAAVIEPLRRALTIEQKLADLNPTVTEFRRVLGRTLNDFGLLEWRTGQPGEALETLRRALLIRQKLADENPSIPVFRNALASTRTTVSDLLRTLGRSAEARQNYELAILALEGLVRSDPSTIRYRSALASSVRRLGLCKAVTGEIALAVADTRRAISLLERMRGSTSEHWYELACCHAALSAVAGRPGSGLSSGDGEAEAGKAMELLRRAVAGGYKDAGAIATELALEPLRMRSDFRVLMFDVVFPDEPFAW
jgi:serine/threonine-protein kinase